MLLHSPLPALPELLLCFPYSAFLDLLDSFSCPSFPTDYTKKRFTMRETILKFRLEESLFHLRSDFRLAENQNDLVLLISSCIPEIYSKAIRMNGIWN